uniref:Uncharacterized protein n=2 Tax=Stomoxys calcitrans TaxID=35570 RepID=A0A1I8PBL3_STOCA
MHQLPLTNMTVNAQLFVRGNGYRPFLYNDTLDFCQFVRNPNRYMFWKIVYQIQKPYSNVNHTCPFNHDVIIDGLILNAEMLRLIPFPSNDYMIQMKYAFFNIYRLKVNIYLKIFD